MIRIFRVLSCSVCHNLLSLVFFGILTKVYQRQSPGHHSTRSKTGSWTRINVVFGSILTSRYPRAIYTESRSTFIWVLLITLAFSVIARPWPVVFKSVNIWSRSHMDRHRLPLERLASSSLSSWNSISAFYTLSLLSPPPHYCHRIRCIEKTLHACPLTPSPHLYPFRATFPLKLFVFVHLMDAVTIIEEKIVHIPNHLPGRSSWGGSRESVAMEIIMLYFVPSSSFFLALVSNINQPNLFSAGYT